MKMTLADSLANFQPVQGRVQVTVQGRLPISRQKESFPAPAANYSPTMGGAPTAYPGIGVPTRARARPRTGRRGRSTWRRRTPRSTRSPPPATRRPRGERSQCTPIRTMSRGVPGTSASDVVERLQRNGCGHL